MVNPLINTPLPNVLYRGKVRDTFDLGGGILLMVATDRISAFDVVLPNGIPDKGYVLARLSSFWFRNTETIVPNHFIAMADDQVAMDILAGHADFRSIPIEVARQSMVVRRAKRIDIECVVRGYLAGSAWVEYKEFGTIGGQQIVRGLREGEQLPELFFTPTTKAEEGHDLPMTMEEVVSMVGHQTAERLRETSFALFQFAHDYAMKQGIIIADTKLEFGVIDNELTLIDELLTPDSSRFWDVAGYSPGKAQPNYDKQFVRDWLLASGWDREPPPPALPNDVVEKTRERYLTALRRLTDTTLPKDSTSSQ